MTHLHFEAPPYIFETGEARHFGFGVQIYVDEIDYPRKGCVLQGHVASLTFEK